ncbi:MAG: ABC-2 transporter permease [Oscillospiraceae bacterium]|nr:ABC-2 transporter permease [Oscillospiraceae bacterium]MBQ7012888.1 ABC-2 transporter permease [Oscillospiraceae bacterium]
MKGLIVKDLMTEANELKRMFIILLVFAISFPFMMYGASNDPKELYGMPMTMCTVMGMVMINNAFGHDERSNWMQYALTNPVSRIQYYHAKLLTHVINVLCGSVLGLVVGMLLAGVTGQLTLPVLGEMLATSGGMSAALCLIGVVLVPLMLKFGVQKGAIIMMLVFASIGGASAALVFGMLTLTNEPLFIAPIIAVLVVGAFITMYLLGRKWMMAKEF